MREFDMIFKGDAAFVCFVADVSLTGGRAPRRVLRICDFYTKDNGNGSKAAAIPRFIRNRCGADASPRPLGEEMKKRLLDAREAVWRAYFAGDRATLEKLIPDETVTIESGDNNVWSNRKMVLDGSAEFAKGGGKLIKLEFPKTEIQVYGYTAIVYSNYAYELASGGQRIKNAGRVTEIFVLRNGQWFHPGWLG